VKGCALYLDKRGLCFVSHGELQLLQLFEVTCPLQKLEHSAEQNLEQNLEHGGVGGGALVV
jgi:hypothetical protein